MVLVIEPLGEIVELEPRTTYDVVTEGPDSDELEIEIEDDVVKLWAPDHSSLEVRKDDGSEPRALADGEWQLLVTSGVPSTQVREPTTSYDPTSSD
jgi:hypothetical protein